MINAAAQIVEEHKSPEPLITLALEGEIGEVELAHVSEMLFRVAHRGTRNVVLDFSEVTHFDYRGVRGLIARAGLFRQAGGDIKVSGMSPYVHAIFRSAGAHDTFHYFAKAAEARLAFERA